MSLKQRNKLWKKMLLKYHPDKVASSSKSKTDGAEDATRAFQFLQEQRGWFLGWGVVLDWRCGQFFKNIYCNIWAHTAQPPAAQHWKRHRFVPDGFVVGLRGVKFEFIFLVFRLEFIVIIFRFESWFAERTRIFEASVGIIFLLLVINLNLSDPKFIQHHPNVKSHPFKADKLRRTKSFWYISVCACVSSVHVWVFHASFILNLNSKFWQ